VHGLADLTFAVTSRWIIEERLVVEVVGLVHGGVEPEGGEDPQVVHLLFGDVTGSNGVEDPTGDRPLDGTLRGDLFSLRSFSGTLPF
jgi:hypothetical protein